MEPVDRLPIADDPDRVLLQHKGRWYVRRSKASPAFLERLALHLERGFLVFDESSGDVEVYRVSEQAPFRVREPDKMDLAVRDLIAEVIREAAAENVAGYEAGLRELANLVKLAGGNRGDWRNTLHAIDHAVEQRTRDPMLMTRMRYAVKQLRDQRRGSPLILPPRGVQ